MSCSDEKQKLMQLFLNRNYLTLPELSKQCNILETDILTLENSQCIPGHTYEKRQITMITCAGIETALTENTSHTTTIYYHSSVSDWVEKALTALKEMDLRSLSKKIKDDFSKQIDFFLKGTKTPGCQSFDQAWNYWSNGTWGKCLLIISAEHLAKKELARKYIADSMGYSRQEINLERKKELSNAVKNYIAASLEFDPYGMRHTLAEEAIEKFKLQINIDKQYLLV